MLKKVTVGIPAYNCAGTLRRTVLSVMSQTRSPDAVYISDNGSSDNTSNLALDLVAEFPLISYIRQEQNIGHVSNFRFLLNKADTEYFMWLAADDYISPSYIEKTIFCLENRTDLTTCVSQVEFTSSDGSSTLADGGGTLDSSIENNIAKYINNPGSNVRIYGLHRTSVLKIAFPKKHFHAFDWALMAGTLLHGKHYQLQDLLMFREHTPQKSYVDQVKNDNKSIITKIFPLLPVTWDLIWRQRIPVTNKILRAIIKSNLYLHCLYTEQYYPFYFDLIGRRIKENLWKLD